MIRKISWGEVFKIWEEHAGARGFSPKTILVTRAHFKMLSQFLAPSMELRKFRAEDYDWIISSLRKAGYAEETIYDLNALMRKLINLAFRKGLVRKNVLLEVENFKIRRKYEARIIPFGDFDRILSVTRDRKYQFLFRLLYYTGMRIGEALALRPSDFVVAGEMGRVRVERAFLAEFKLEKSTKNGKTREVPFEFELLRDYLTFYSNERIFTMTSSAARKALRKACALAGVPRYRLHEFRHTFVSNLIRAGVPLATVANVAGDLQTTIMKRYSHMFAGDEELVIAALRTAEHAAFPT